MPATAGRVARLALCGPSGTHYLVLGLPLTPFSTALDWLVPMIQDLTGGLLLTIGARSRHIGDPHPSDLAGFPIEKAQSLKNL